MKIRLDLLNPVRVNVNVFKEAASTYVLGLDDFVSQQRRELIRAHLLNSSMPYDEFHKQGRKTDYEMGQMLSKLIKPSKVSVEKLSDLKIANFEQIEDSGFRGQALYDKPEDLKVLKDAGVERIIDLSGCFNYEKNSTECGLEYNRFLTDEGFWKKYAFLGEGDAEISMGSYMYKNVYIYELKNGVVESKTRKFISDLINFFDSINKGNYYIGCDFGTDRTDDALALSYFLNPKTKLIETPLVDNMDLKLKKMLNLVKKLTQEEKEKLGWSFDYEEIFNEKVKKALIKYDERYD